MDYIVKNVFNDHDYWMIKAQQVENKNGDVVMILCGLKGYEGESTGCIRNQYHIYTCDFNIYIIKESYKELWLCHI